MLKPLSRFVVLATLICLIAPAVARAAAQPVELELLGRTVAGGEATAEIAALDPETDRVFATNTVTNTVDVYDFADPTAPASSGTISLAAYGAGPSSVDFSPRFGGILAVAVEDAVVGEPGTIEIFNADGDHLTTFAAGALPDMVTFTDDGRYLLAANEGEPADDGTVDPEGSVTVVDLSGATLGAATVRQATFAGVPTDGPVRDFTPGSTLAEDLEPEYIDTTGDRAWVTVQEANAIALLDIPSATFSVVRSMGFKDYGLAGNGFDATDADDAVTIETHPNVFGMYQPDGISAYTLPEQVALSDAELQEAIDAAIAAAVPPAVREALRSKQTKRKVGKAKRRAARKARRFADRKDLSRQATKRAVKRAKSKAAKEVRRKVRRKATKRAAEEAAAGVPRTKTVERTRLATANEGDARDYTFFSEVDRAGDLALDPAAFPPGSEADGELGRLNVTTTLGNTDADPDYEELYAFGARSMTLLDEDARVVADTGDELETIASTSDAANYNKSNGPGSAIDGRSDDKGPEPEAVTTGQVGGSTYAFLGSERSGTIYAYDLASTPGDAEFAGLINTREDDLGPEGMEMVPAAESPTGAPMLLVTYEVSGTVAAYSVAQAG